MDRWFTYIKKRFRLIPQLILISGLSLIACQTEFWHPFLFVFGGLLLFFFLLRAMDEYKDYDKDCIAHPDRPLPQGLIARGEMKRLIQSLIWVMVTYSALLGWQFSAAAGLSYLVVSAYLWAMFCEFNLSHFLSKRPLLYTISHQLIVVPLSAFLIAARGGEPIFSIDTLLVSMVLFGGFFAYEICRKLDPAAHPILSTYPSVYGRLPTALLAASATLILSFCGYFLGLSCVLWPIGCLLLAALVYYCLRPSKFKMVEALSTINLLACIYSLGAQTWVFS
jgi:4-hydroxybenzoate polyprenyltransferase